MIGELQIACGNNEAKKEVVDASLKKIETSREKLNRLSVETEEMKLARHSASLRRNEWRRV